MRALRSKRLRAALYAAFDGKCAKCGEPLPDDWHADHIVPWVVSQRTNIHEMQPLCPKCNLEKGTKMLRKHQAEMRDHALNLLNGLSNKKKILVYCTPGGGKSALPAILMKYLGEMMPETSNYRIMWVVPRDALRKQGERSFLDLKPIVGHTSEIRAAGNDFNPARSTMGYVINYQALPRNPDLHVQTFEAAKLRNHPYILFLDECHHIPSPEEDVEDPEEKAYYKAIAPLVELCDILVMATGTLERHDKKKIAFLPYVGSAGGEWVDLKSKDWHVIRYTRTDALEEGAVVPLHMTYADGAAIWTSPSGEEISVESIAEMERRYQSPALRTSLETEYAYALIDKCLRHWQTYKSNVFSQAKLLIIAPGVAIARQYYQYIRDAGLLCEIAVSEDGDDAKIAIDRFKGIARPHADILVSVAIAYEGLDVKEITHVALLTKYRSKPWIEQAISRANRAIDGKTHGYIYAPDDPSLRIILGEIEREQQGVVVPERERPRKPGPDWPPPPRVEISPIGSELTGARAGDLDGTTRTTYEEDAFLSEQMAQFGLHGSTIQLKQLLTNIGVSSLMPVNGKGNTSHSVLPPVSVREKKIKDNILKYIGSVAKGDVEIIKQVRTSAFNKYGPIDQLDYEGLREQWAWLQATYPGGVTYESINDH
jgi:superfamily II DNA or RNA helicase